MTLEYDALKEMKFADFKKAFKQKQQWKKAKAAIVLVDYKIEGKKVAVVLPLKKSAELKKLYKRIKADKHPSAKLGGGLFQIKQGDKKPQFEINLTVGSLSEELLLTKASKTLNQLLNVDLVVGNNEEVVTEEKEKLSDAPTALFENKEAALAKLDEIKKAFATMHTRLTSK